MFLNPSLKLYRFRKFKSEVFEHKMITALSFLPVTFLIFQKKNISKALFNSHSVSFVKNEFSNTIKFSF